MRIKHLTSLSTAVFCCFYTVDAWSASPIFSDYGQVQNVQKYSSNPFWNPNSPYNQRVPQPVYATGTDLNAGECINVVNSLINMQCSSRNNCRDLSLKDVKPTLMVQLSNLPGKSYLSACGGYIDYLYESYVSKYGNNFSITTPVAFPEPVVQPQTTTNNNNSVTINNPYTTSTPKWKQEILERTQELQELQQQNGAGSEDVSKTFFPKTYADYSVSERMNNEIAGYAPYKDKKAYDLPQFKNFDEWCNEGDHKESAECKIREEYSITYDANGGENAPGNPSSYKPIKLPVHLDDPTRDDCEKPDDLEKFAGWVDTDKQAVFKNEIPKGTIGDLKLKAKWNCKECTVVFNAGTDGVIDGAGTSVKNVPYPLVPGSSEQVDMPTASKSGHTFEGWYDAPTGGHRVDSIEKKECAPSPLYARYAVNDFTITLVLTETGTCQDPQKQISVQRSDFPYDLSSTGINECDNGNGDLYDLEGWYADAQFTTPITSISTAGNKTVYAKWRQQDPNHCYNNTCTITFYPNSACCQNHFTGWDTTSHPQDVEQYFVPHTQLDAGNDCHDMQRPCTDTFTPNQQKLLPDTIKAINLDYSSTLQPYFFWTTDTSDCGDTSKYITEIPMGTTDPIKIYGVCGTNN